MDYLLRTVTESDMEDALIAAGLAQEVTDADGEVLVLPVSGVTIDHIGAIPAQVDPKDPAVILRPGDNRWHTNIRVTFPLDKATEDLLPTFDPLPSVPYRVFI
jgi:hypothetical protein